MSVFDLSSAEKLQLVEDLWDDLAADPTQVPVYDWQRQELDRRRVLFESSSDSTFSWDEVQSKTRARRQS